MSSTHKVGNDETNPLGKGARLTEHDRERRRKILRFERMYERGFLSPGGVDAIAFFCQQLNMREGMNIIEIGSGLGGLIRAGR